MPLSPKPSRAYENTLDKNPDFISYILKCESGVSNDVDAFRSGAHSHDGSRLSAANAVIDNASEGSLEQCGTQLGEVSAVSLPVDAKVLSITDQQFKMMVDAFEEEHGYHPAT